MADYRVSCVSCGRELQMIERLTKAQRCQICLHQENLRKKREQEKQMTNKQDMVNHPPHYTSDPSGIECIEIAEHLPFCLGNCYKYLHRAGLKGDMKQDLEKALWYADRARLNDEKIDSPFVRNRIQRVARSRNTEMYDIFIFFSFFGDERKDKAFFDKLKSLCEK